MADKKMSETAPNWCRTCGRRPNDPMAALCLDTHHRTLERLRAADTDQSPAGHELAYAVEKVLGNRDGKRDAELDELLEMAMHELNAIDTNLPAELAEQAIAEFLKERDEALGCPDATDAERAESARLIAALAATGKQQVGEVQEDDLLDHLSKYLPSKLMDRVNEALNARQPGAQEPDRWEIRYADGYTSLWKDKDLYEQEISAIRNTPGLTAETWPLFRHQPAQGIELGQCPVVEWQQHTVGGWHAISQSRYDDYARRQRMGERVPETRALYNLRDVASGVKL